MRASEQTLAKYAVQGCGPEFQRYSRDVVYNVQTLDEWARSRLSKPVRSTSQTDASATRGLDGGHSPGEQEALSAPLRRIRTHVLARCGLAFPENAERELIAEYDELGFPPIISPLCGGTGGGRLMKRQTEAANDRR
jgi:hypothetical protein